MDHYHGPRLAARISGEGQLNADLRHQYDRREEFPSPEKNMVMVKPAEGVTENCAIKDYKAEGAEGGGRRQ
jgi:hypothetical protein